MNEEEEYSFQQNNSCWICGKLIDNDDEKVRDHDEIPVIFHNLRGYDSHLIFSELNKFHVKIDVIPNGLEK